MKNSIRNIRTLAIFIVTILTFSCIPTTRLKYLQSSPGDIHTYERGLSEVNRIKPGNELYIRVSSFDDINYNFFSSQTSTNYMNYGTETSMALISYPVNDSGYIDFPILGHIFLKDLTLDEATVKMKKLLSEYFNQPTVLIRLVNKRITIMGEVSRPGTYIFTKDHLNIMEALSMAGDINFHGNKKDVFLIRQEAGTIKKTRVNMTRDSLLVSDAYIMRPDDILYVETRSSIKWSVISVPISLVLNGIATAILVYSFFRF